MNISYLLSILDLYLIKEKNGSLIIEVDNIEELVKIKFCYSFDTSNKTFVKISKKMFFDNIEEFLQKVQGNLLVEKENLINVGNQKVYQLVFTKERKLSFVDFQSTELKLIRENLKNLKSDFTFDVDNLGSYDKKLKTNNALNLSLSMGFTSYITLFLTSILFLDVFIISLWVFKVFIS